MKGIVQSFYGFTCFSTLQPPAFSLSFFFYYSNFQIFFSDFLLLCFNRPLTASLPLRLSSKLPSLFPNLSVVVNSIHHLFLFQANYHNFLFLLQSFI